MDGDAVNVERALERTAQPQRDRAGGRLVSGHQDERELVAAEPRESIVLAHRLGEARPHLAKDLVAGMVAEGVVELLEAVEVDEQQRERVSFRDRRVEAVEQMPAVAQAGQIVGLRLALALAQPVGHGDPRARHAGQDGQHRQGHLDLADARKLAHREQRERGHCEGDERHQHGPAEVRAGIRAPIPAPGRGGEERSRKRRGRLPTASASTPAAPSTTDGPGCQRLSASAPTAPPTPTTRGAWAPNAAATAPAAHAPMSASSHDSRRTAPKRSSTSRTSPTVPATAASPISGPPSTPKCDAAATPSAAANARRDKAPRVPAAAGGRREAGQRSQGDERRCNIG